MRSSRTAAIFFLVSAPILAHATVFATIRGVIHDPQHRPIANAQVSLQAAESTFSLRTVTASNGTFEIDTNPHRSLPSRDIGARVCRPYAAAHCYFLYQPGPAHSACRCQFQRERRRPCR